jgi:hypothetical protein
VLGDTLEKAWPSIDKAIKQACVKQVVKICKELAQRRNNEIYSVNEGSLLKD